MARCAGFYPVLKSIQIDDKENGNGDGILNPSEAVKLMVTLENKSVVDTTPAVKLFLRTGNTQITIQDSAVF